MPAAGSSRSVLDAFFYGRAFAEVLNEKLGEVADDLLIRVSKLDAERQQASRHAQLRYCRVQSLPLCMCVASHA